MSTSRPFKYNPSGTPISGTLQVGSVSVALENIDFSEGGWWNGPDEELGYVICLPAPLNNHDTPVPGDDLTLDPNLKATDITLSNNNQTATQVFSYQQSVLGETLIAGSEKVMFSVKFTSTNVGVGVGSRFIGVGRPVMNYQGNPFGGYPGNDNQSAGFSDDGKYYFNGNAQSGYPTWTSGDIIDIVVSHGQYWWIRVNGGNWNNNASANPTSLSGGKTMDGLLDLRPVLCPSIYGTMQILNTPQYGCPDDYNFLGHTTASVKFIRSLSLTDNSFKDLVNSYFNQNFSTATDCGSWLTTNGYWTSWTSSGTTQSGYIITIKEVGSNIVMSGSGTLNISDLTLLESNGGPFTGGGLGINTATFISGSAGSYFDVYGGIGTTPSNFGSGSGTSPSSTTGDVFGIIYNGAPPHVLVVPTGYTSGAYITSSQTFNSQTFNSLGLVAGTYSYTWGTGSNAELVSVLIGGTESGGGGGGGGATGSGDFNVTITQVGPDVVWSGSGSFNLAALTSAGPSNISGGYSPFAGAWAIGPNAAIDTYSGTISNPGPFGTSAVSVTSNTGSSFGILPGGSGRLLYVPSGYVSNTNINGTSTYANTTIAGAGLTTGVYTWTWGTGGNTSTLVMTIS